MADTLSSNPYEPIFTAQKALFRTGATRAREWRLDQLARMERMVSENEAELQDAVKSDFKTASQETSLRHGPRSARSTSSAASSTIG